MPFEVVEGVVVDVVTFVEVVWGRLVEIKVDSSSLVGSGVVVNSNSVEEEASGVVEYCVVGVVVVGRA